MTIIHRRTWARTCKWKWLWTGMYMYIFFSFLMKYQPLESLKWWRFQPPVPKHYFADFIIYIRYKRKNSHTGLLFTPLICTCWRKLIALCLWGRDFIVCWYIWASTAVENVKIYFWVLDKTSLLNEYRVLVHSPMGIKYLFTAQWVSSICLQPDECRVLVYNPTYEVLLQIQD